MNQTRISRHSFSGRLLHWLFALLILILLATGLLPVFGLEFNWVPIHWISGVALAVLILVHILIHARVRDLSRVLFHKSDFSKAKPGKYSLEQKAMHNFVAITVLVVVITGIVMMIRIDTPFWERNPYFLEAGSWGLIYVLHGLIALVLVSTIMLHVYFALRPEKRLYLRSMFTGWISNEDYRQHHDPERWPDDG